ncbi:DUF4328 domain-containing protein [Streptomyces sp. NPDC048664]|uniref:DUF4328 domain-containing protein n=1 Tax=Streptomyces sp. NPDC048664 TaxID=3154505 RepID=UPI00343637FE
MAHAHSDHSVAVPAPPFGDAPHMGAPGAWLRSPVGLGRAAVAALALVVATDTFASWVDFLRLDITSELMSGAHGADLIRRAHDVDRMTGVAGSGERVALVISAVVYLCWLYRVRVNAEVFDQSALSHARGWTIGGWFTPIVNLWFPRQIVLDIWDASTPWGKRGSHGLVNVWWGLWISSLVTDQISAVENRHAETTARLHLASRFLLAAHVVDIAAALLAIAVVLRLTRMQHKKALAGPLPA